MGHGGGGSGENKTFLMFHNTLFVSYALWLENCDFYSRDDFLFCSYTSLPFVYLF
jgi:hypothetical protein